jgi:VCBS repeat-containing protein
MSMPACSGPANLSLTPVSAPPSAPIAGADSGFAVGEDGSLTIDASTLLANDRSLSLTSSALTFQGLAQTSSASGATLGVDAGQITYTPGASLQWLRAGETHVDSFQYRIVDDAGLEGTGDVTVTVSGANDAPNAVDDALLSTFGVLSPNLWSRLLGNDHDPDHGDPLTIVSVNSTGTRGAVTFDAAAQTLRYQAQRRFVRSAAPRERFLHLYPRRRRGSPEHGYGEHRP